MRPKIWTITSLAALFDSTESVLGIPVANDEVSTIKHPAMRERIPISWLIPFNINLSK